MITLNDVSFSYANKRQVLSNITCHIEKNKNVGIIGANGAGKSTILKLLVGLEQNYIGNILVDNIRVERKNINKIREKIGYVFQDSDSQLFMPTVYEDIAFGPKNYKLSKNEIDERVFTAMSKIGIENLKNRSIYSLSGGEKKLVSLATVLAMSPEILIFDEPTIALDPQNRRKFINTINSLDGTKIITSHDLDLIYDTCEETILISHGKIVKQGQTVEILNDKKLLENNGLELPLSLIKR